MLNLAGSFFFSAFLDLARSRRRLPIPPPSAPPPLTKAVAAMQNCFFSWTRPPNFLQCRSRQYHGAFKAPAGIFKIALVERNDGVGTSVHGGFQNHVVIRIG